MEKIVINAAVNTAFEYASDEFRRNSSAQNWRDLETAMWALQAAHQLTELQASSYVGTPLRDLISKLAEDHKKKGEARSA